MGLFNNEAVVFEVRFEWLLLGLFICPFLLFPSQIGRHLISLTYLRNFLQSSSTTLFFPLLYCISLLLIYYLNKLSAIIIALDFSIFLVDCLDARYK